MADNLRGALIEELAELAALPMDTLLENRIQKLRAYGQYRESK